MFLAMCVLFYSRKWGVVLITLATAIGVARVASHVHHRIDVVGAMVFAIVAALGRDGPLCG